MTTRANPKSLRRKDIRQRGCARNLQSSRSGFTLIETALATIIIGVGVLSMMTAQQAFHKQNGWSSNASIATRLGNEIREMTFNLPRNDPVTGEAFWGFEPNETLNTFDDLDDFDGLVFSADLDNGPMNAQREIIPNMDGWSQTINVYNVDQFDITTAQANGSTEMIVVEVIVEYHKPGESETTEMTRVTWVAPR